MSMKMASPASTFEEGEPLEELCFGHETTISIPSNAGRCVRNVTYIFVVSNPVQDENRDSSNLSNVVLKLKESSGLTWAQFAHLFGVTRRAVHFWVEGGNMSAQSVERLTEIQDVVNQLDGATPAETKLAFFEMDKDRTTPYVRLLDEVYKVRSEQITPVEDEGLDSYVGNLDSDTTETEEFAGFQFSQ